MCKFKFRLIVAVLTFVFGVLGASLWIIKSTSPQFLERETELKKQSFEKQGKSRQFPVKVIPYGIKDAEILNLDTWLIVDFNESLWKTDNRGKEWKRLLGDSNGTSKPSFVSPNVGFIVSNNKLLKTINGGDNWNIIQKVSKGVKNIYFLNEKVGWKVGNKFNPESTTEGQIWYSNDGGLSWKEQEIVNRQDITEAGQWDVRDVYFVNDKVGWAVGKGVMFQTSDGGQNWKLVQNILGDFEKVEFADSKLGWVIERELEASIITVDGGKSWKAIKSPNAQNGSSLFFTKRNQGVLLDSRGYVSISKPQHNKWEDVVIHNKEWDLLIKEGETGNTFIGEGFDESLICIWLILDKENVLSLFSKDGGKSWQE